MPITSFAGTIINPSDINQLDIGCCPDAEWIRIQLENGQQGVYGVDLDLNPETNKEYIGIREAIRLTATRGLQLNITLPKCQHNQKVREHIIEADILDVLRDVGNTLIHSMPFDCQHQPLELQETIE